MLGCGFRHGESAGKRSDCWRISVKTEVLLEATSELLCSSKPKVTRWLSARSRPAGRVEMASAAVRALAKVRTPRVTLEQLTGEVADRRRAGRRGARGDDWLTREIPPPQHTNPDLAHRMLSSH